MKKHGKPAKAVLQGGQGKYTIFFIQFCSHCSFFKSDLLIFLSLLNLAEVSKEISM